MRLAFVISYLQETVVRANIVHVCSFFNHLSDRTVGNMFNEDAEWNDEEDALILSKNVFGGTQKRNSSSNVTVCAI